MTSTKVKINRHLQELRRSFSPSTGDPVTQMFAALCDKHGVPTSLVDVPLDIQQTLYEVVQSWVAEMRAKLAARRAKKRNQYTLTTKCLRVTGGFV